MTSPNTNETIPDHLCHQKEIVAAIEKRLGKGDVLLARIEDRLIAQDVRAETDNAAVQEKLTLIKEQTTKHNGRMTKIEERQVLLERLASKPKFGWPSAAAVIGAVVGGLIVISQVVMDIHHDRVAMQRMELVTRTAGAASSSPVSTLKEF